MDLWRRRADDGGFTMVVAMGVMLVVMLLGVAAYAAANGDSRQSGYTRDQKAAYAAAEAGLQDYLSHLNQDPNYWAQCDNVAAPTPVNQPWTGTGTAKWRTVPDGVSQYAIELLPVSPATTCSTADPDGTMMDPANATFRIRATGRASAGSSVRRSIVATFRRTSFLDYIWWTKLEDQDPVTFAKLNACPGGSTGCVLTRESPTSTNQTNGVLDWANTQCNKFRRDGRQDQYFTGQVYDSGTQKWSSFDDWYSNTYFPSPHLYCTEITFGASDKLLGPVHTQDSIRVGAGSPGTVFGDLSTDVAEIEAAANPSGPSPIDGWAVVGGGTPSFKNLVTSAKTVAAPPTNGALVSQAWKTWQGGTKIVLAGNAATGTTTATVTNGGSPQSWTLPQNAVLYVQKAAGCSGGYDPYSPAVPDGTTADLCGDVAVSGTYASNITIASADDVVVTGDLTRVNSSLLGLIANNYVRVAHPSTLGSGTATGKWPKCSNTTTADRTIHAAILALNGSFMVDRYGCGAPIGTLHVDGAIAQLHRGAVAIGTSTGYIKDYTYDRRLRYRAPPRFLNPVNAGWAIVRQLEQSPAAQLP